MKKIVAGFFTTLVLTSICIAVPAMAAGKKTSAKTSYELELEASENKKVELEKAVDELKTRIQNFNPDKSNLELYILAVDDVYLDLFEELKESEQKLEEMKKLVEESRDALAEKKDEEKQKYEIMSDRVRYLYEEGKISFSEVLFGSSGIADFLNRMEYSKQIMQYDRQVFENYETARVEAEHSESLLTAHLHELEALQTYKAAQLSTLEELASQKAAELAQTSEELSIESYLVFSHWDELMESDNVSQVLAGIHEEDEASYLLENIMWPLPGKSKISSPFGYREAPIQGATVYHNGIDIPANTGTEVKAALSGVVVNATYNPASGNYVKISHGNGVYTTYCHASKLMVEVGDEVKKGQTVILVGSTGVSTGPHLHFGIKVDGAYRDPLDYVWYGKE